MWTFTKVRRLVYGFLWFTGYLPFISRDMGYYVQFQGYCFFLQNIQIQSRNTNNIKENHFKFPTREEKLYVHDMASLSRPGPLGRLYLVARKHFIYISSPKMLKEVEVTAYYIYTQKNNWRIFRFSPFSNIQYNENFTTYACISYFQTTAIKIDVLF